MSIYNYTVKDNKGNETTLEQYKGKVLLIINSATECGFTPQYDELQDLYEKYADQGFEVLDFPCNQFGNQAPGSDAEIASFCSGRYGIQFPLFSKADVNGDNALPLFNYLKEQKGFNGFDDSHPLTPVLNDLLGKAAPNFAESNDIKWNFTKFLVSRSGEVIERFEPTADMKRVEEKVKEYL